MNPIEVTTEYTYPVYRKFFYFNIFRRSIGSRIFSIVFGLLMIFVVTMMIVAMAMTKDYSYISLIVFWAIFLSMYLIFFPRMFYKGLVASRGLSETYRFTADELEITGNAVGMQINQKVLLSMIHSAHETKECFYIYFAKNQACLISKKGMNTEDCTRLAGLLAGKVGTKFKLH